MLKMLIKFNSLLVSFESLKKEREPPLSDSSQKMAAPGSATMIIRKPQSKWYGFQECIGSQTGWKLTISIFWIFAWCRYKIYNVKTLKRLLQVFGQISGLHIYLAKKARTAALNQLTVVLKKITTTSISLPQLKWKRANQSVLNEWINVSDNQLTMVKLMRYRYSYKQSFA